MLDHRQQKLLRDLSLRAGDDQLSDEERVRLNELVEGDDDACRLLLEYSMLDADLVFYARTEAASAHASSMSAEAGTRRVASAGASNARVVRGLSLAAAAILAAATAALALRPPARQAERAAPEAPIVAQRQPQPVATLTLAPGAEFSGRAPAENAVFFEGRRIELVAGEAHVSMASGADFVLKSPGAIQFVSSKHVKLLRGELTAQVAEWGSGFIVDTDAMRVTDLGTRFAVAASTSDVETHVLQGRVRVQPLKTTVDGRRSVLLSEGEALRVKRGPSLGATRIDAQQERFPESLGDFRPFKPILLANTGVGLAEGDEDSHWRIIAGPVGAGYRGPQFGVVCVPDERYAPNEPMRSQWISVAKDLRPGGLPNSVFTFETTFNLAGFDLDSVTVAAQILADNGVRAIRINDQPAPLEPWDDNVYGVSFSRNRFRLVEMQHGFRPGVNKLEIDVWNGVYMVEKMKNDPNPVALRVEFQAFGRLRREEQAGEQMNR
jgi:hypothetical protein